MIELVVSVCLLDDPSRCKDVSLVNAEDGMTSMQCMMQAPPVTAEWIVEHPKWQLKSWTCRRAGQIAKI
ncbi:MAG: hypothetical protein ABL894_05085 [Hyphomicrobium sp.]